MSELSIRVRKLQDNGSTFRATPDTLYLGGVRSAKVDTLRFELPEEWAECAVTLHVQRLSGTLPDPQALDAGNRVEVDRRWTLEKQGTWMLMAVGAGGYVAMTKPAQYTCYDTIDTDSTTETIDPSVYEQFVDLVLKSVNEAKDSAKQTAADRAAADQILTDTKKAGTDAVTAIGTTESKALEDVEDARTGALTDIGTARAGALEDIETARTGAVQDVTDTKAAALTEMEEKRASALQEMQASADAAAGSAEKAAASESNAGKSEKKSKASEEASARSEAAAKASQEAAATSEANALKYSQEVGAKAGTDKTLSIEDAPADAKAVGDALNSIDLSWDAVQNKPEVFPPSTPAATASGAFSGIQASGNNYVRFTDGTQICWIDIKSNSVVEDGSGNIIGYRNSFPVPFANTDYSVSGMKANVNSIGSSERFYFNEKKTTYIGVRYPYSYTDSPQRYSTVICIGRWK